MSHSPPQSPSSHSPLRDDNEGASSSGMKGNCRHSPLDGNFQILIQKDSIFLDVTSGYEFWLNVGLLIQRIKNKLKKHSDFQYISGYRKALCFLTHSLILFIIYYIQNLQFTKTYSAIKQDAESQQGGGMLKGAII